VELLKAEKPFSAYKGGQSYVFVSYSHLNSSMVIPELIWLKERGFNVWYDEGIEAGTEWREELGQAILRAGLCLYFVTPDSVQSENCRKELNFAIEEHIPVLAVHLVQTELPAGLKLTLSDRQAILKYEISTTEYQRKLQSSISSYLDQPTSENPTNASTVDQPAESKINEQVDLKAMRSIAVLPFANMSTNEETGFLAEGLSEDILDNLAQAESIRVVSRSAAFQYTDPGQDPVIIGEKLKVAYLLEGSVRQRDDNVRITAQLIRTGDGFHVWSKSYEQVVTDDFEMQTTVAKNIAYITQSELAFDVFQSHGWKQDEIFKGIDPIAIRHYINANDEHRKIRLGELANWHTHLQLLNQAVAVDPNFVAAYMQIIGAVIEAHTRGALSLQEAVSEAHKASNHVIALEGNSFAQQLRIARMNLQFDLDYARANAAFEQLSNQLPKLAWPHYLLGQIALREGRAGDAIKHLVNALPSFDNGVERAILFSGVSWLRFMAGDYEGALEGSREAMRLTHGGRLRAGALVIHALSLRMLGRGDEVRPFVEESWRLDGILYPERYISHFADLGEKQRARNILSNPHYDLTHEFFLALGHLALGDVDSTFTSIKAGIENHDPFLIDSLVVAQWWDPIRDDPRFDEMLELLDSKVTHTEQYLRDHSD